MAGQTGSSEQSCGQTPNRLYVVLLMLLTSLAGNVFLLKGSWRHGELIKIGILSNQTGADAPEVYHDRFESFCQFASQVAYRMRNHTSKFEIPYQIVSTGGKTESLKGIPVIGVSARDSIPNNTGSKSTWFSIQAGFQRFYTLSEFAAQLGKYKSIVTFSSQNDNRCLDDEYSPMQLDLHNTTTEQLLREAIRSTLYLSDASSSLLAEAFDDPGDMQNLGSKQLQQNRDVLAAINELLRQKTMCVSNNSVFLWIEDDVSICPEADQHLSMMKTWLLAQQNPPVYIRFSMGFIGIMFHCKYLNEVLGHFEDASITNDPGIDWTTARFFANRTKVYRWNLFDHPRKSSIVAHNDYHINQRNLVQMKCWDININTFVPWETFDYVECNEYVLSPCEAALDGNRSKVPKVWSNNTGVGSSLKGIWPSVPAGVIPRWLEPPEKLPANVSVHFVNHSCASFCPTIGKVCTSEGMEFVNSLSYLKSCVINNQSCCSVIGSAWDDFDISPHYNMESRSCTLRTQIAVCDAAAKTNSLQRICACESLN